ncbi:SDR family NAD(P)-dependent oxidoreductase [Mesorhizobium sp. YIM 152430]|uniref:SDR family NAD(P)-dependent oxidoreductase n=1 Tax=Mesorhizobium sp. YIM 152430 TaxID=3031761 RepID=UPI0023DC657A|nr:SDR family NAD(P)-dependent oxidoreductase [Mesorhizobium sp. YIM 152430]MDF1599178.1 SDR family NAD(P)-dependent oxidoreductase [Mesorhizobium sp. YIM 152430]
MRVLVTGGAKGLRRACVQKALAEGAQVSVLDMDEGALSDLAAHVAAIRVDLADAAAIIAAVDRLKASGPFDLVVMNAGINATGPFETLCVKRQARVIAVNLTAPMLLTMALLKADKIARGGRLVFVGSISHFVGYPGASIYAGTKDGLTVFARSLRRPLRRSLGVKVQVVAPGPMDTEHARLHSPTPDDAGARISPAIVAGSIWRARASFMILQGAAATGASLFGRLFPGLAGALMRRAIYNKLTARALVPDEASR